MDDLLNNDDVKTSKKLPSLGSPGKSMPTKLARPASLPGKPTPKATKESSIDDLLNDTNSSDSDDDNDSYDTEMFAEAEAANAASKLSQVKETKKVVKALNDEDDDFDPTSEIDKILAQEDEKEKEKTEEFSNAIASKVIHEVTTIIKYNMNDKQAEAAPAPVVNKITVVKKKTNWLGYGIAAVVLAILAFLLFTNRIPGIVLQDGHFSIGTVPADQLVTDLTTPNGNGNGSTVVTQPTAPSTPAVVAPVSNRVSTEYRMMCEGPVEATFSATGGGEVQIVSGEEFITGVGEATLVVNFDGGELAVQAFADQSVNLTLSTSGAVCTTLED